MRLPITKTAYAGAEILAQITPCDVGRLTRNNSYQHVLKMLPTEEWTIFREDIDVRADGGIYLGKKGVICGL